MIYQIYPRSFLDSNGDGVGDLAGITARLDYVASLGVDAIWVSPFFTSPMHDFGYDVSDYRDVDPIFGTLDDFRALLDRAHGLGLKVIIDQVLSHTSSDHDWFRQSGSSRTGDYADWYVWADAAADGSPPNNWLSVFGGRAWTWSAERGQYYLHNFLSTQPDLNFHNPAVRAAQLDNVRFWLDLGVDGFRFDVVNFYYHDRTLADNPPAGHANGNPSATTVNPYFAQRHIHDIDQPETLGFLGDMRALLDEYPGTTSVGEIASDNSLDVMAAYTQDGDKLHMAYTFDLLNDCRDSAYIRQVVERLETRIGDGWACWALSNHDVVRSASRWGHDEDARRFPLVTLALLLSLRGSVSLYQGEELGLPEAEVPRERLRDPWGIQFWPEFKGRDGCRTPMVWDTSTHGGFSSAATWLPVHAAHLPLAVELQEAADDSVLNLARRLIHWRKSQPALIGGEIELLTADDDVLCWLRRSEEQTLLVAINLSGHEKRIRSPRPVAAPLTGHGFSGKVDDDGNLLLLGYDALFAPLADG